MGKSSSTPHMKYTHYEYIASAKVTPVLREAVSFFFEPRRFVASGYSKTLPRRVRRHFLKPCKKHSFSGYLFVRANLHTTTTQRRVVYRGFCFDSSTVAVSEIASEVVVYRISLPSTLGGARKRSDSFFNTVFPKSGKLLRKHTHTQGKMPSNSMSEYTSSTNSANVVSWIIKTQNQLNTYNHDVLDQRASSNQTHIKRPRRPEKG